MKRPDPFLLARAQGHVTAGEPYVPRGVQGIQILAQWQSAQTGNNAWLAQLVARAFMRFRAMHLPGQPAVEMLPITAEMWVDVLLDMNVTEEIDRDRIEAGFRGLCRKLREWPQPADLIEALPRRDAQRRDPRDIPARRVRTETEEATAAEALSEMQQMFKGESR